MFVALGFVLAALVALLVGRGMWAYAVGLGRRRGDRDKPSALARAQSDRDQLRAEYAMLSRKLELRLADLKTRLAEQTAEVSRNRNRIDRLVGEIEARDKSLEARAAELGDLRAQIEPLETELAHRTQALQKLKEQLRERDEAIVRLGEELAAAEADIAERDRQVEVLRAEVAAGSRRLASEEAEAHTAQERLARRIDDLVALSSQIETQRRELTDQQKALKALKADIERPHRPRRARKDEKAEEPAMVEAAPEASSPRSVRLERQILEAERETGDLQKELRKLDRLWTRRLAALGAAVPGEGPAPAGSTATAPSASPAGGDEPARAQGGANVISLASRIRALQKGIGE
jgi:chromosome segregation ATPase